MAAAFRYYGNAEPLQETTSSETSTTAPWSSATTATAITEAIAANTTAPSMDCVGDSTVGGDLTLSATSLLSIPFGGDLQCEVPQFEVCVKDNTDTTTITTKNVWTKIGCSTASTPNNLNRSWTTDATGRATYTGSRSRFCHFHATITTVLDEKKGRDCEFAIFRGNGLGVPVIQMCGRTSQYIEIKKMSSASISTIGPAVVFGDFFELWVRNLEKGEDINILDFDMIGVMLPTFVPDGPVGM